MSNEFFSPVRSRLLHAQKMQGSVTWRCPSNIALVKYWGEYEEQLPCNPSISLTLKNTYTETKIDYQICEQPSVEISFQGNQDAEFNQLIIEFLERLDSYFSFLTELKLDIHCLNSFPHPVGIALSASAIGSIALCLCSIEEEIMGYKKEEGVFYRKASFIARLGSGIASRSIYGGSVLWGKLSGIEGSSDLYGLQLEPSQLVNTLNDSILIANTQNNQMFRSIGHPLKLNQTLTNNRIEQTRNHTWNLIKTIRNEDYFSFCQIVEEEALSFYFMLLRSKSPLLKTLQNTDTIISKVRAYRSKSDTPVCFTLDESFNVHLLYPNQYKNAVVQLINNELLSYCEEGKWLDEYIGNGPVPIS